MKLKYSGIVVFAFIQLICYSQNSILLNVHQPPRLLVNAGRDTTILSGETVILGGDFVAQGGTGNFSYYWSPRIYLDNPYSKHPSAINVLESTRYVLIVYDDNCNSRDTINIFIDEDVNRTDAIYFKQSIKLYPIPTKNILNIDLPELNTKEFTIQIFDITGKNLFTQQFNSNKITLSLLTYPKGYYSLIIRTSQFETSCNIIKE
jgi:hypothetical protein